MAELVALHIGLLVAVALVVFIVCGIVWIVRNL